MNKVSPEVRESAVRMAREHRGDYPSLWAAIESIAPKIGCRLPERDGSLVRHSDRGSRYVCIRYNRRLADAGIVPSMGSKSERYDNALADTINRPYKAKLIHRQTPSKNKEAVKFAALE